MFRDMCVDVKQVFYFYNPTKIIYGAGSIVTIVKELEQYGCKKPLLVSTHTILKEGSLNNLVKLLNISNIPYAFFYDAVQEPDSVQVAECLKAYQLEGCDGFVCIGGGNVMDTAKGAAILSTNKGLLEDYAGIDKVKNLLPPLFCIPNTHGTGSEVAPATVVRDTEKKIKYVVYSSFLFPKIAILDPDIVCLLPQKQAVIDSFDALAHAIESVCASTSHPLSEMHALSAIELIGKNIRRACTTQEKQPALMMQLAASMALFAIGSTKAGLIHAAALALGGIIDVPHGIACSLFMPHVMEFNLISSPDKFRAIAKALGVDISGLSDIESGIKAIQEIKQIQNDLELPKTLKNIGFKQEMLPALIEETTKFKLLINNGHRLVGLNEITSILKNALG